jgi:hypothetical protein
MENGKKLNLTDEEVRSIAEELEMGLIVYVNIETKEIKAVADIDTVFDPEPWEEMVQEIEDNYDSYLRIRNMDSSESFKIMEEFVETISDEELRKKLELGLSLSKPFRNFKDIIDSEYEYKKKWYAYRDGRYIEFVKERLNRFNEE